MIKLLKRRREMIMAQIVNQERYCRTKAKTARLEALQARVELAKRYHQDFQDVELDIFMRCCADEQSQMDEFEEIFCYVVAELTYCINLRTAEMNTQMLYVSKEDFPRFDGRYDMWKQFEFIYTIVIHNNKTLSNKTKFQLLIELLAKEPRSVIDDISLSDANYNDAWLQIKSHYNSPKFIINSVVRNLLFEPCVTSGDAWQLKQLVEATEGAIRKLNSLGYGAQARDPWLIGILLEKLDIFTQKLWMSELKHLDFPTFTDFMKFLNARMQILMGYRYVCQAKKHELLSAPTGTRSVRKLPSLENCQRNASSVIVIEEQETCSRRSSIGNAYQSCRKNSLKGVSSSSPSEDYKPQTRGERRPSQDSNCQLNEKQAIALHEFKGPLTVAKRSTGAIRKVKSITMDKNSGASEFLV